jgi:hypothetical protein
MPDGEFAPKGLGRVLDPSQEGQTVGRGRSRRVKGTPAQERARGERNARMKALTTTPTGDKIVGMTPTKAAPKITPSHAMGFEPGDTLVATRHFSVGRGDSAVRLIAGQEHTVTKIIGTNQVAIDTGNGTELVVPTFDKTTVRRTAAQAGNAAPKRLTRDELNTLLSVSANTYLADMADGMGRRATAKIEMPMASLADTRDTLRDRLAHGRDELAGWGDLATFESALAKLDAELASRGAR